jgi:hypothetical protein
LIVRELCGVGAESFVVGVAAGRGAQHGDGIVGMLVPIQEEHIRMKHPRFYAHPVTCDRCAFRRGVERSTRPRLPRVGGAGAGA